jgi:hypothetical protein
VCLRHGRGNLCGLARFGTRLYRSDVALLSRTQSRGEGTGPTRAGGFSRPVALEAAQERWLPGWQAGSAVQSGVIHTARITEVVALVLGACAFEVVQAVDE